MAYIGNNLTIQQYAPQVAYFNGTGSQTAFTLPQAVVSAAQIIVAIENVIQNPSSAFTVSGTTLTFTSAPPSGTNNIWVEYTSLQTNTVVPSSGTVGQAQMASPTGTGNPVLQTSPTITGAVLTSMASSVITSGTSVPTTSGTIVPISTTIPSWAKRITVMLNQVSVNASSTFLMLQVGSGSFSTSGYNSTIWTGGASGQVTNGLVVFSNSGSASYNGTGVAILNLFGSNTWIALGNVEFDNVASTAWSSAGRTPALAGALDRIQITTPLGTAAFTGGSVNILYE